MIFVASVLAASEEDVKAAVDHARAVSKAALEDKIQFLLREVEDLKRGEFFVFYATVRPFSSIGLMMPC